MVAIASFLKQHPGFAGEMVLFHDGLPEERRAALTRAFPPLRFEPVNPELRERLTRLGADRPDLRAKLPDFYSLEAFRLDGYRKVLYCDCDLLFRRPIDDLFEREDALLCCGDGVFLRGGCHDAATYRPIHSPSQAGAQGVLERTFGCGLLLIDERLTGERTYSELLALVAPETWRGTETVHSDQFILNRYLAGRQTLVSAAYNYRLHLAREIRAREGLSAGEASVLHFSGRVKPWRPETMLRWNLGAARFPPYPAFSLWYEAWIECLTSAPPAGRCPRQAWGKEVHGVSRVYGALHDVERAVGTHLFGIAPNNSGSTFLKEALATCRATWNLSREGQHVLGFAGPIPGEQGGSPDLERRAAMARAPDRPPRLRLAAHAPGMVLPGFRPRTGGIGVLHQGATVSGLRRRVGPALPQPEVPVHGAQPLRGVRRDLPELAAIRP